MKKVYKNLLRQFDGDRPVRLAVTLVIILVWILIDKGNVYGQQVQHANTVLKGDMAGNAETPMLRYGSGLDENITGQSGDDHFSIRPNPVVRGLVFDFEFTVRTETPYDVIDPQGRLAAHGTFSPGTVSQKIDLSGLSSGMYLVKVGSGSRSMVKRIIKN